MVTVPLFEGMGIRLSYSPSILEAISSLDITSHLGSGFKTTVDVGEGRVLL